MAKEYGQSKEKRPRRSEPVKLSDRELPYNREAEANVLGAIIRNPSGCDEVGGVVRVSDFDSNANRRLFKCLVDMHNEGRGIDLTLLTERLYQNGEMEEIGGEAYLAELMTSVPVAAHAVHYAKIVRDKAVLRSLIETSSQILVNAYESDKQPRELIAEAEESIFRISDDRSGQNARWMNDIVHDVMKEIDNETGGGMEGIQTGFTELDKILNGLRASSLNILAARPSMGKTALATNIAEYVSIESKQPVLFFSLEMSETELAKRMLCARGQLNGYRLATNTLSTPERERFMGAVADLQSAMLLINDSGSLTVSEIAAIARRTKRQNGLALVIIDYLTLIEADNPMEPRQEQVAKIARRLKRLARELDVPVLCLAQVNRQVEQTKDNRPRLSNLRESGAIEQDADVVMFVHREEYYMKEDEAADSDLKGKAEIIIAKQRNGSTGTVELRWRAEYTRFSDLNEPLDDAGTFAQDYSELGGISSGEF